MHPRHSSAAAPAPVSDVSSPESCPKRADLIRIAEQDRDRLLAVARRVLRDPAEAEDALGPRPEQSPHRASSRKCAP